MFGLKMKIDMKCVAYDYFPQVSTNILITQKLVGVFTFHTKCKAVFYSTEPAGNGWTTFYSRFHFNNALDFKMFPAHILPPRYLFNKVYS